MSRRTKRYKIHQHGHPTIEIKDWPRFYKDVRKKKQIKEVYRTIYRNWLIMSLIYDKQDPKDPKLSTKLKEQHKTHNRIVKDIEAGGNGKLLDQMNATITAEFVKEMTDRAKAMKAENDKLEKDAEKAKDVPEEADD